MKETDGKKKSISRKQKQRDCCLRSVRSSASLFLLSSFSSLLQLFVAAQEESSYDEISVYIKIPYFGVGEIDAVIRNEELYLPVTNLFDFLKIRNVPSEEP